MRVYNIITTTVSHKYTYTVGARERPLNARVVLLHECAQIAI